jgi:hypothetical protein
MKPDKHQQADRPRDIKDFERETDDNDPCIWHD